MRILPSAFLAVLAITSRLKSNSVLAKQSSRPRSAASSSSRRTSSTSRNDDSRQAPVSRRRPFVEEDEELPERPPSRQRAPTFDDEDSVANSEEDDYYSQGNDLDEANPEENDEDDILTPPSKRTRPRHAPYRQTAPQRRDQPPTKKKNPTRRYDSEEEEDDYMEEEYSRPSRPQQPAGRRTGPPPPQRRGGPPPRGRPGGNGGRVVPYSRQSGNSVGAAATFTKGWESLKSSLPDPTIVKEAALSGITAVQQSTSSLSKNIYREIKGLTSSELEQVMLKATSPDDTPVKGKHVERLVGVTYQISSRYDIYDAVLRKLWNKMAEKDWRTTIKALYILHRFSADGAPEHAPALKARLRELRRTRDPKRKDKYFNSKELLAGENSPASAKYRAFMARYAHYVLLRAQCFGGMFEEISSLPKPDKKSKAAPKPITSTSLRSENLEAAALLLKAGVACQLKDGEECENTAIAAERVASDLIGLCTAVAIALNRALRSEDTSGLDGALIKKWCQLYSESLLPQTRAMVKKTSPKLDAYGLFLPSRMGTTVPPDLLEKGLSMENEEASDVGSSMEEVKASNENPAVEEERDDIPAQKKKMETDVSKDEAVDEEVEEGEYDDEYEYDEEEYDDNEL